MVELQKRGGSGNLNETHLLVMLCGRDARADTYIDAGGHQKQQTLPSLPSSFDALTEDVIKGAWEKTGYFPWNPDKFLNHKYVRHELYVDEHGNPMVELDSKSDKINTFLQQLDMNIKKLNDAGFNGDVFAIVSWFSMPSSYGYVNFAAYSQIHAFYFLKLLAIENKSTKSCSCALESG